MKSATLILALLLSATVCAQSNQSERETCSENGSVAFPMRGWVGYTNTGQPVSDMQIECFTDPDQPPVASVKSDDAGSFSFPDLKPGKYYLQGSKPLSDGWVVRADDIVTVTKGAKGIACLVAEAEQPQTN